MKKQKTSGLVVFLLKSLIPCLIPKIYEVKKPQFLVRAKGFEPSTSTLARLSSTNEH